MTRRKTKAIAPDAPVQPVALPVPGALPMGLDPVLHRRMLTARIAGFMPPDVDGLTQRRAEEKLEDALDAWESNTQPPCYACGVTTRRWGRRYLPMLPNEEPPNHVTRSDGRTLCKWCSDFISEYGEAALKQRALEAAAGTRGGNEGTHGVMFHEQCPTLGDGTAWSHVNRQQARDWAMHNVHPSLFVTTPGAQQQASIPGLLATLWSPKDLPRPAQKFLTGKTITTGGHTATEIENTRAARHRALMEGRA